MSHISKILIITGMLSAFSSTMAEGLDASAFLVMLGQKTINPETKTNHNLDVFLGLAGLDLKAEKDNFEGMVELLFFPAGYGFSYIQSTVLDSQTNEIVAKKAEESKTVVAHAWGRYTMGDFQIQIGRSNLKYSNGFFFGDYLHRGSGPILDYGGLIQNCAQFQYSSKMFTTSLLLGVNDINLDRGYLTFREVVTPTEQIEIAIGYKANLFDPIQNEDAEILNNLSLTGNLGYMEDQKVFAEFGMRGLGAENEDQTRFPFMLGFTIPTAKILSTLAFEIEFDSKREDIDELSSFGFGAYAIKEWNPHFKTIFCINNGSTKETGTVVGSFEMIVGF